MRDDYDALAQAATDGEIGEGADRIDRVLASLEAFTGRDPFGAPGRVAS